MRQFTKSIYIVNSALNTLYIRSQKKRTAFILHHAKEDGPLFYYNDRYYFIGVFSKVAVKKS